MRSVAEMQSDPRALSIALGERTLLGALVELLGGSLFPHAPIVCVLAYVLSGSRSIYAAQRVAHPRAGAS